MEKLLTIVIPAYNVEKYLSQCLNSLCCSENLLELEILVVNDGSLDNTVQIAQSYVEKYPNSVTLIMKENGGHGSTINCGMAKANGKYFKIIDGDDWVDTNNFNLFVKQLKKCDEDIVLHDQVNFYEDKEKLEVSRNGLKYIGKTIEISSFPPNLRMGLSNLTIKTSILKNNKIYIDENMFYVDMEFILYPLLYVNTIIYFDIPVYVYRLGNAGQSVSISMMEKRRKQHEKVIFNLLNYYNSNKEKIIEHKINEYIIDKIAYIARGHYYILFQSKNIARKECVDFDHMLKKESIQIYNEVEKGTKSIKIMRYIHFHFYALFQKIYIMYWKK